MPKFARVVATVKCPVCSRDVTMSSVVGFQWGYCSHALGAAKGTDLEYALGDEIRWGALGDGSVPAWHYFANADGNIGDPEFSNLLIKEGEVERDHCPHCATHTGPMVVEIRAGRIASVRLFPEWAFTADIVLTGADGSLVEREDWSQQGMTYDPVMPRDFKLVSASEMAARRDAHPDGA